MKLGIDIIDLTDPDFRDRHDRALRLILNEEDKTIAHPKVYWLLWAAKEAIFKCQRQPINFAPTQLTVQLMANGDQISFTSGDLKGGFEIGQDYLAAYCSDELSALRFEIIKSQHVVNGDDVRQGVTKFFEERQLLFEVGGDEMNLPILLPAGTQISLSHHRHFGAFAYPKSILDGDTAK